MQKSPIWYKLREQSHGTASSLGKFIPGDKWTSEEELNEQWKEYLENKPFVKTHTMEGHMKWGTVHEDLALFCFAEKYNIRQKDRDLIESYKPIDAMSNNLAEQIQELNYSIAQCTMCPNKSNTLEKIQLDKKKILP